MLEYMKQEANRTLTENGAAAFASTGSECLDLFAAIGALRREGETEIISRFVHAYTENADIAMKLLFFARDIRGGLGERRVFRVIFNWLAANEPGSVCKNIEYVAEYGRYDDLLALMGTACEREMLGVIRKQFVQDMAALKDDGPVSLLAKWLPSANASNVRTKTWGKKMARALGLSAAEYRKALTALRRKVRIIENNLREKDYSFDYEKQPSKALFKYRKAFIRNDKERYNAFINAVAAGAATLHADHVAPYELVAPYLTANWYGDNFMKNITSAEKEVEFSELPQIIFWNVASRNRQQPVTQNEQGVALVSGVTPRIFSMVAGGVLSPYNFMMEVLGSERYAKIAA